MTNRLEGWLWVATRHLSANSAAQVGREIQQHHELEREAAMERGAGADEADRLAVAALGDPRVANREYRNALLTTAEAKVLGEGNREARVLCGLARMKWLRLALPLIALVAAVALFFNGDTAVARVLAVGGTGMSILFAAPLLPIYPPSRGRVFRWIKWMAMIILLLVGFWPDVLKWSWLLASSAWPMVWIEWTRISIRRKLPVAEWPKQLYL